MKVLIFIPARGGSKGIPRKNMVKLNGKPLIQYTLETSKELMGDKTYDWVPFISTDDLEISKFCAGQGYNMEYTRPKELAGDKSDMIDAIEDALKWLNNKKNILPDAILLLQPTSPLRKVSEIINAIKQVGNKTFFSIVSVTKMCEHPYECIETNEKSWTYLAKPKTRPSGRQDYNNNYFFIDGSFYFASFEFLQKHNSFLIENKTQYHVLNQRWPIDIDDEDDLKVAEAMIS